MTMPDQGHPSCCAEGLAYVRIGDQRHLAEVKWIGHEWGSEVRFMTWIAPAMEPLARQLQGCIKIVELDADDFDESPLDPYVVRSAPQPADLLTRGSQL